MHAHLGLPGKRSQKNRVGPASYLGTYDQLWPWPEKNITERRQKTLGRTRTGPSSQATVQTTHMGKITLTPTQKNILDIIADEPYFPHTFYMTGGTALSSFYYHHRESEDIDLFTQKPRLETDLYSSI